MQFELFDETALLAAFQFLLSATAQYHPHFLRPLDKSIEIVGPEGVLILVSRQFEDAS